MSETTNTKVVRISDELVEQLSADWSPPVQLRIYKRTSAGGNVEEFELVARDLAQFEAGARNDRRGNVCPQCVGEGCDACEGSGFRR